MSVTKVAGSEEKLDVNNGHRRSQKPKFILLTLLCSQNFLPLSSIRIIQWPPLQPASIENALNPRNIRQR